jgi:hypothetical protein
VSDGATRWDYDPQQQTVTIDRIDASQDGQNGLAPFGAGVSGLEAVIQQAQSCYTPQVKGEATVAGRRTYILDLGVSKCPSNSAPELNGRQVLWIDQETFFVLKAELYGPDADSPVATTEITSVAYNAPIAADQFTFAPPANAVVQDLRVAPAASAAPQAPPAAKQTLTTIRQQVSHPVFVPAQAPAGLAATEPTISPEALVTIVYRADDGSEALTVINGPAGCCLAALDKGGETLNVSAGTTAHFLDNPAEFGGPTLWWEQDGAYVALSGPKLTKEDLVKIVGSMSQTAELESGQ